MNQNKIVSSICYFSVFFLPVIVPLGIYLFFRDYDIRHNAKYALTLQIVPLIGTVTIFSVTVFNIVTLDFSGWMVFWVCFVILMDLVTFIWNIVKGIHVLFWSEDLYN